MVIFNYKSGSNPYVAKTREEVRRMLKKYDGRIVSEQQGQFYKYYTIEDTYSDGIINKYKNIEKLRQQVKNNQKAMLYYEKLKKMNKGDQLYGWMFENDAIFNDTLDELDLYNENYLHDILVCYYGELESILQQGCE